MKFVSIFKQLADLITGALERRIVEHEEFLQTFKHLVENLPQSVVNSFGTLSDIEVITEKGPLKYGIELTCVDYIWWKLQISNGAYFTLGVPDVKLRMIDHLSKCVGLNDLDPVARSKLIYLLEAEID